MEDEILKKLLSVALGYPVHDRTHISLCGVDAEVSTVVDDGRFALQKLIRESKKCY